MTRRILCLLLALILALTCLTGCRKDAEADAEEDAEETAESEPSGLQVDDEDEPLIIEIPEDQELGGD